MMKALIIFIEDQSTPNVPLIQSLIYSKVPEASVRNSTHDKVMQQSSDGKANQTSGFPPGISWACTPKNKNLPASNILWKKSNQGFSLLHLKGMFQLNPVW